MQQSPSVQPCESPSAPSLSLSAHTDQSQLLGCSLSWDATARAGGSWCCPQPCPLQHPHLREAQFVSVQWENLSTPGNQWRLCLSGFYIHFCHRPPASHYLSLISHCIFGTILSPLPVMFIFSGFLELSSLALFTGLLSALQLCWGTVGITAPLIEGQTPKSIGCETEF